MMVDIVVYDNGGKSCDRYTVICDENVFGMSKNPTSPQGVNLYIGERNEFPNDLSHLGKQVDINSLPDEVQKAIQDRCKDE